MEFEANSLSVQVPKSDEARRRFVLNIASNAGWLAFNAAIALWFTRYLIDHLGVASYGVIPLATSVTAYMSILTVSINSAVGRFLTIDLARGDAIASNRTFNTALFGSTFLVVMLVPIASFLVIAAPYIFNIPDGQENDVRWIFVATTSSFFVGTVGTSFRVSSFAYNRFELRNGVNAASLLTKVGVVAAFFAIMPPRLWQVGAGMFASAIVAFLGATAICHSLTPHLTVAPRSFDRARLRQLTNFGGWALVNQIGTLLLLNMDLLVANVILGAEAAGYYGSVRQWSILLRSIAGAVAEVFTPVVLAKYAKQDFATMGRVCRQAVKLLGLGMALPIGLLCGLGRPLLFLWLGTAFQHFDLLLVVLIFHLCIDLAVLPLYSVQTALNRIRWPGIVSLGMGLVNLGLAILWAQMDNWGVLGIAAAGAVVMTLRELLFTPIYGAAIMKLRWTTFLLSIIPGLLGTVVVGLATYTLAQMTIIHSWFELAGIGVAMSAIYGVLVYFLVLRQDERRLLRSLIPVGIK